MSSPNVESDLYVLADKLFKVRDAAAMVAADLGLEGESYAEIAERIDTNYSSINALVGVHARPLVLLLAAVAGATSQTAPLTQAGLVDLARLASNAGSDASFRRAVPYGPPRRQLRNEPI